MIVNSNTQLTPSLNPDSVSTKPSSRAAKTPGSSSKPQSKIANHQLTPSELKVYGIRVRDFAYESKLPPLPTIYRHPQQIQPGVTKPLERKVTEPDDSQSQSESQTNRKLERTATEPVTEPALPTRTGGLLDIEDLNSVDDFSQPLNNDSSGPLSTIPNESQRPDIDSAKAPTASLLSPTSSNVQSQVNTDGVQPQSVKPDDGFSTMRTRDFSNSQINAHPAQLSFPARSPSSSPLASSSTTTNQRTLRSRAPVLRTNPTHDPAPRLNATRYQLRKRPSPPAPLSPPRPSKRPRKNSSSQPSSKPPRRYPVTAQSSHSPVKNKDTYGSSSSHTMRQSTTASGKTRRKRG